MCPLSVSGTIYITLPMWRSSQVYQASTETFLPTPVKSHYLFNMRDVAKVVEGVMQVSHERYEAFVVY